VHGRSVREAMEEYLGQSTKTNILQNSKTAHSRPALTSKQRRKKASYISLSFILFYFLFLLPSMKIICYFLLEKFGFEGRATSAGILDDSRLTNNV